jgi:thiol-disulfide isomerase/thioredoxin
MTFRPLSLFLTLLLWQTSPPAVQVRAPFETVPEKVMEAEFQSLEGAAPIKLSDYKSGVVVVALWASWCDPCRMAVRDLSEFNKEFASRGVTVVALTTEDPANDSEMVRDFLSESKPELRLGWVTKEATEALTRENKSIPLILVITGEGVIVTRFRGWSEHVPKMLRETVEKALTNPPPRPPSN